MKRFGNTGVSTVFGSILLLILAVTLSSALFVVLHRYTSSVQEGIRVEEARLQERIVLHGMTTQNLSEPSMLLQSSLTIQAP